MNPDFLDLLRALLAADARFMVVGAYAVAVHGRPRGTKDFDVWVDASEPNAPKVLAALLDFGAPLMGLTLDDLKVPGAGLQVGIEPGRVDILTKISGITFDEAWPTHVENVFAEGVRAPVIGFEALLTNKRASGRPQDLADVSALEKLSKSRPR